MREIVLDTETTGIDTKAGHRIIEIGCVEIINRIPTGNEYHVYIDPERDIPADAVAIHGITAETVRGKPRFAEIAASFLDFIGDADPLVIHNARFDVGFLNFELAMAGFPELSFDRVVDTLALARRKHPAGPNSLDALCRRYRIDNTQRVKHGAIVDSLLLADVYVELLGERQAALSLLSEAAGRQADELRAGRHSGAGKTGQRQRPAALPARLSEAEVAAHRAFIEKLGDKAQWWAFWKREGVS